MASNVTSAGEVQGDIAPVLRNGEVQVCLSFKKKKRCSRRQLIREETGHPNGFHQNICLSAALPYVFLRTLLLTRSLVHLVNIICSTYILSCSCLAMITK